MNKLLYLTGVSLKRKVKTKWFLIANLILLIALVGVMNIDHIINYFGGDFDSKTKVYVIDETNYTYDLFKVQLEELSKTFNDSESSFEIKKYKKSKDELIKELEKSKKDIGLTIKQDKNNYLDITMITNDYMDAIDYQLINNALNTSKTNIALSLSNIDQKTIAKIYSPLEIKREYLDEDKKREDESASMIMTTVFPFVILPFFMLTIFLVQMIGAEVNDEKTTKGMEIIISNVSPKTHFFSKVIAGNTFVIMQGLLFIIYGLIAYLIRNMIGNSVTNGVTKQVLDMATSVMGSDFVHKLVYIIPVVLVLMLLTFLAYSLLAGILASVTTSAEDFQQLQTPIMVILMIGYFLSVLSSNFEGSILIKIMSYIPFISAILSPSLLVLGQITIFDSFISMFLMVITNILLIKYGLKIYKVGILNYSSSGLVKKMFEALKS